MPDTVRHLILGGDTSAPDDTDAVSWVLEFAESTSSASYPYIAAGKAGTFSDLLEAGTPIEPDWSVGAPLDAWPDLNSDSNFAVWLFPETNIQHIPPTLSKNTSTKSSVEETLLLIDQVHKSMPGAPIYIFEDWADTELFEAGGAITDATRSVYLDYTQSTYHSWFETLVAEVKIARPEIEVTLVPAASELAALAVADTYVGLPEILLPPQPDNGSVARAILSGAFGFTTSFAMPLPEKATMGSKVDAELGELYPELSKAITVAVLGDTITEPVSIAGTDYDDTIPLTNDVSTVDLGDGTDTLIIQATGADSNVIFAPDGSVLVQLPDINSAATVSNVERLEFEDGTVALDVDGTAGQVYRLYQAAFDRTPDAQGLGFWIDALDTGEITLEDAAQFFMTSAEFEAAYGSPDTVTDVLFLTLLYVNALDRPPDDEGFIFWREQQDQGVTRAEMMVFFSESVENVAQVAPEISDGIWYL